MDKKLKIGVIFGGKSSEKEISLATGRYIYQLIDPAKFESVAIFMDEKGHIWQIPDKLIIQNTTNDIVERLKKDAKEIHFEDLKKITNVIFIALLGKYGEDGSIQGLLELLGIPYTGSGILASALGMDKKTVRILLDYLGYRIPKGIVVSKIEFGQSQTKSKKEEIKNKIKNQIGYPCVVKPTREGSSVGVVVSHKEDELEKAFEQAFYFDNEILIEEYIKGKEFMCVVFGNDNPHAMLPTEVSFQGEIHTYDSKYMPGGAQYFTPIRVKDEIIKKIQKQAQEIYQILGLKGYGRVDGFVLNSEIYIGEVHTGTIMVPSSYVFHEVSRTKIQLKGIESKIPMTPKIWVSKIIEMALEAHKNKKGLL
jgi:D-alanine-D-alanine ligase